MELIEIEWEKVTPTRCIGTVKYGDVGFNVLINNKGISCDGYSIGDVLPEQYNLMKKIVYLMVTNFYDGVRRKKEINYFV